MWNATLPEAGFDGLISSNKHSVQGAMHNHWHQWMNYDMMCRDTARSSSMMQPSEACPATRQLDDVGSACSITRTQALPSPSATLPLEAIHFVDSAQGLSHASDLRWRNDSCWRNIYFQLADFFVKTCAHLLATQVLTFFQQALLAPSTRSLWSTKHKQTQ